jgi:hypothetical protein
MISRLLCRNLAAVAKNTPFPTATQQLNCSMMAAYVTSFGFSAKKTRAVDALSKVSSPPEQNKPETVKKVPKEKKKGEVIEIKTEGQLQQLIEKAENSKQLEQLF